MKQVTITTGKVKMLVVDLPEGARIAGIMRDHLYYYSSSMTHDDYPYSEIIPAGFEGTECFQGVSHITEEDWKGIVDEEEESDIEDHRYAIVYPDYTDEEKAFSTATESGMSLLKANGVVMENPLGEYPDFLSGVYDDNGFGDTDKKQYKIDISLWQQAQEQVWVNPHVFIKL